jgi:hypothetical protein
MKLCGKRYDVVGARKLQRRCKLREGHRGSHGMVPKARAWRAFMLWLMFDEAACAPLGPIVLGITLDETAVGYYEPRFGVVNLRLTRQAERE